VLVKKVGHGGRTITWLDLCISDNMGRPIMADPTNRMDGDEELAHHLAYMIGKMKQATAT